MARAAVNPALVAGINVGGSNALTTNNNGGGHRTLTPSEVNSFRISAVIDRLSLHVRTPSFASATTNLPVASEFSHLCLSLARGIDYAIASSDKPARAQDLPTLLKQVSICKCDSFMRAAIMVLMISVKNACQSGWFSDEDSEQLQMLVDEIGKNFRSGTDFITEPSNSHSIISTVMSRYFPTLRISRILAYLEVQPGYNALFCDFQISKDVKSSAQDKIRLFVAERNKLETSACLINPQEANFLLNGRGVDRRTNVFMDTGPQAPTFVTKMLKYGSNLLQAVGQFNGNYIVVVAFMSSVQTLDAALLQDYVQPTLTTVDSDSEIIEGPSRISLNCPISFKHIKTPVKGHSCKHFQCFDFNNYVDMNSRRPSWRCPLCNQHVCFTDIRIDQNMVKVLKDVGENIVDVIISSDGSWKAIMREGDRSDKDKPRSCSGLEEPGQPDSSSCLNDDADILDLTEVEDMDVTETLEANETKMFPVDNNGVVNQSSPSNVEDGFWAGVYLSTYGSGTSGGRSDLQFGNTSTNFFTSPLITDAVSSALDGEAGALVPSSMPLQIQIAPSNALQLQQFAYGNTTAINEYGRLPSVARHVSRTPIAVQALPAPASSPSFQQRPRNSVNTLGPNGSLLASQNSPTTPFVGGGFNTNPVNLERQQHFSRSYSTPLQPSRTGSSPLPQYSNAQVLGLQAPNQTPIAYTASTPLSNGYQSTSQQQTSNLRGACVANQSSGMIQPSAGLPGIQIHQGGFQSGLSQPNLNNQRDRLMVAAQRAMARPVQFSRSSIPVNPERLRATGTDQLGSLVGTTSPVGTDAPVDLSADQNWRPTGRMRGSLSGQAYSDALSQFIIQPIQQAQTARPPSNPASLQVLMANRAALQAASNPSTGPASTSGTLGNTPIGS